MAEFTCTECGEEFKTEFPYGENVTCPHCGTEFTTDMEEDWDNMWCWLVGKVDK